MEYSSSKPDRLPGIAFGFGSDSDSDSDSDDGSSRGSDGGSDERATKSYRVDGIVGDRGGVGRDDSRDSHDFVEDATPVKYDGFASYRYPHRFTPQTGACAATPHGRSDATPPTQRTPRPSRPSSRARDTPRSARSRPRSSSKKKRKAPSSSNPESALSPTTTKLHLAAESLVDSAEETALDKVDDAVAGAVEAMAGGWRRWMGGGIKDDSDGDGEKGGTSRPSAPARISNSGDSDGERRRGGDGRGGVGDRADGRREGGDLLEGRSRTDGEGGKAEGDAEDEGTAERGEQTVALDAAAAYFARMEGRAIDAAAVEEEKGEAAEEGDGEERRGEEGGDDDAAAAAYLARTEWRFEPAEEVDAIAEDGEGEGGGTATDEGPPTVDRSDGAESMADSGGRRDPHPALSADSSADSSAESSFYVGAGEEGFAISRSVRDSDISDTDSEGEAEDDEAAGESGAETDEEEEEEARDRTLRSSDEGAAPQEGSGGPAAPPAAAAAQGGPEEGGPLVPAVAEGPPDGSSSPSSEGDDCVPDSLRDYVGHHTSALDSLLASVDALSSTPGRIERLLERQVREETDDDAGLNGRVSFGSAAHEKPGGGLSPVRRRLDLGGGEGVESTREEGRARDGPPPRGARGVTSEGAGPENPEAATEATSPPRPPADVGRGMPSADGGSGANAPAASTGTSDGELATTPTEATTTNAPSAERTDPTEATPARATKTNAAQDATLEPPSARTAGAEEEEEEEEEDDEDAEGVPDSVLRMFRDAERDADALLADVLASPEPKKKKGGGGGDREAEGAGSLEGRRPLPPPSSPVAAAAPGEDVGDAERAGREDEGGEADEASTAAPSADEGRAGAFPRPVLADAAPDGAGGGSRASRGEGRPKATGSSIRERAAAVATVAARRRRGREGGRGAPPRTASMPPADGGGRTRGAAGAGAEKSVEDTTVEGGERAEDGPSEGGADLAREVRGRDLQGPATMEAPEESVRKALEEQSVCEVDDPDANAARPDESFDAANCPLDGPEHAFDLSTDEGGHLGDSEFDLSTDEGDHVGDSKVGVRKGDAVEEEEKKADDADNVELDRREGVSVTAPDMAGAVVGVEIERPPEVGDASAPSPSEVGAASSRTKDGAPMADLSAVEGGRRSSTRDSAASIAASSVGALDESAAEESMFLPNAPSEEPIDPPDMNRAPSAPLAASEESDSDSEEDESEFLPNRDLRRRSRFSAAAGRSTRPHEEDRAARSGLVAPRDVADGIGRSREGSAAARPTRSAASAKGGNGARRYLPTLRGRAAAASEGEAGASIPPPAESSRAKPKKKASSTAIARRTRASAAPSSADARAGAASDFAGDAGAPKRAMSSATLKRRDRLAARSSDAKGADASEARGASSATSKRRGRLSEPAPPERRASEAGRSSQPARKRTKARSEDGAELEPSATAVDAASKSPSDDAASRAAAPDDEGKNAPSSSTEDVASTGLVAASSSVAKRTGLAGSIRAATCGKENNRVDVGAASSAGSALASGKRVKKSKVAAAMRPVAATESSELTKKGRRPKRRDQHQTLPVATKPRNPEDQRSKVEKKTTAKADMSRLARLAQPRPRQFAASQAQRDEKARGAAKASSRSALRPPSFLNRAGSTAKSHPVKSTKEREEEEMERVRPFKARGIGGGPSEVRSRYRTATTAASRACSTRSRSGKSPPPGPSTAVVAARAKPPSFLAREAGMCKPTPPRKKVTTFGEQVQRYLHYGLRECVGMGKQQLSRDAKAPVRPPSFLLRRPHGNQAASTPSTEARELEECRKQFRALPLPSGAVVVRSGRPPRAREGVSTPVRLTTPSPFRLRTNLRGSKPLPLSADDVELARPFCALPSPGGATARADGVPYHVRAMEQLEADRERKERLAEEKMEQVERESGRFRARSTPKTTYTPRPIVPTEGPASSQARPLTQPRAPRLSSAGRVEERRLFDRRADDARNADAVEREAEARQRREAEEEEIRRRRTTCAEEGGCCFRARDVSITYR